MNRTIFTVAGMLSASSLMLLDSAVKGAALLVLAAVAVLMLRRDSAATRHLVWLLAMVALLAAPLLSALLPQWRVLPEWAGVSLKPVFADLSPPASAMSKIGAVEAPQQAEPVEFVRPSETATQPAAELADLRPALETAPIISESPVWSGRWIQALPLVWGTGCFALILRLAAARWLLWNSERRGTVIGSRTRPAMATADPIATALETACLQLGIGRPITLLIHQDKSIPVVWGIFRCHLLLPAVAKDWSGEQLRSVLLHELAHVKRRDLLAQLLTQIACALHWFNPLVWFAAWRLGVERERACDDLVLASGVRPSAYAGHLLEVVTALAPARWTQSCGLAMARKSSLEGRLGAVLSAKLNRRGVSMVLAASALAIAVGIAVPIAMLRGADQPPANPVERQEAPIPKAGMKLDPDTEANLKWGEPVNGLRAALAIKHATAKPKAGDFPDLYVVVQNVSKTPIRLSDADVSANIKLRELRHKKDGRILYIMGAREPALGDRTLQTREAVFLPMFDPDKKFEATGDPTVDGHTLGATIAEGVLKNTNETLVINLQIEKAPAGAWTGKLVTGDTSGAEAAGGPRPKSKEAQSLFKVWLNGARADGKIPGGALGPLARTAERFIKYNPTHEAAPKLAELLKRIDQSHDWTQKDAVELLDQVTAIYAKLPSWVEDEPRFALGPQLQKGQPLPVELKDAPWGQAAPNGLRMAWLLEPRAAEHRLGTALKSRILFHNAGKDSVVFRALTFNQPGEHKARDANGAEINITSTYWTTLARVVACRLAPGEFTEMTAPGIGVGAIKDDDNWQGTRVGSWIGTKVGDEVTFMPAAVSVHGDEARTNGKPDWWLDFIKNRLSLDAPAPAEAAERRRLLDSAVRDLFGAAPAAEEAAAFVADREPNALDALAKRLAKRTGTTPVTGSLISDPTKFRVLPVDPDAAKKPRTVSNPGWYTLGDNVRLSVSRRPDGERIVNEASIRFFSADQSKPAPGRPHEIKLPDGYNTWAAAWLKDTTVLWVQQKGSVRSYDFTNPAQVKETTLKEPADFEQVPRPILDALGAALAVPDAPKEPPASPKKEGAEAKSVLKVQPEIDVIGAGETALEIVKTTKDPDAKWQAIRILGNLRYQRAVPLLLESLTDQHPYVRSNAARALGDMKVAAAAGPLTDLLAKESNGGVIQQTSLALVRLRCADAILALKAAAKHEDVQTRMWVLQAIGGLGGKRDVQFLAGYLEDPAQSVQACAAQAIEHITGVDFGFPKRSGPSSPDEGLRRAKSWWEEHKSDFRDP